MRDDRERLRHMLEAMVRIDRYAARGEEAFRRDELIQNWMVRDEVTRVVLYEAA